VSRADHQVSRVHRKTDDFVYMPLAQHPVPRMVLMLRSSGDPLQLIQAREGRCSYLSNPNLPMLHTMSYEDYYLNQAVEGPRIAMKLVGYHGRGGPRAGYRRLVWIGGVQREPQNPRDRYTHSPRRGKLGRAAPGDGKGIVLVGMGTVIGLAMGFALEQLMNSMLFNAAA